MQMTVPARPSEVVRSATVGSTSSFAAAAAEEAARLGLAVVEPKFIAIGPQQAIAAVATEAG